MTSVGFNPSFQPVPTKDPAKAAGAAKDFEALLIGQMLQSIREQGSGWLGGGDDDASATAFGLGEQYLARAISAGGGLGLGRVIERGLSQTRAEPGNTSPNSTQAQTATAPGTDPPNLADQR
jgi:Rod binding domain-containing protein